jgi:hypothetical protein
MQWAGFQGTFGDAVSSVTVSADDEEWHTFLVELHKEFGTGLFTVKDIVERLAHDPYTMNDARLDSAALPGDLPQKWGFVKDGKDGGFRKSLGWWLRNHPQRREGPSAHVSRRCPRGRHSPYSHKACGRTDSRRARVSARSGNERGSRSDIGSRHGDLPILRHREP